MKPGASYDSTGRGRERAPHRRIAWLGLSGLVLAVLAFWFALERRTAPQAQATFTLDLAESTAPAPAFARALEPRIFDFPQDHGPHLEYQTEWWYYTGNLETDQGAPLGYQLTFFRRGLTPQAPARASDLAANEIYFAHFAVSDIAGGRHAFFERFSRDAIGLAGASGDPFRVWLEDWEAQSLDPTGERLRLTASEGGWSIDLTLDSLKPVVAHGQGGLSPKSEARGNASYYLSGTRLHTVGQVALEGEPVPVSGESWFDHEWSTSALGPQAVGWDWFSVQLSDERELMLFQIRNADGSLDPVSGGTLIEADGRTLPIRRDQMQLTVETWWRSPASGTRYPARWHVVIPGEQLELSVEPRLADQEMRVSFPYWEGAVRVSGTSAGAPINGLGYLEMTGYERSMQGVF